MKRLEVAGSGSRAAPALCSLTGVGPQTQFVLWKGVVGRSHIVHCGPHCGFGPQKSVLMSVGRATVVMRFYGRGAPQK